MPSKTVLKKKKEIVKELSERISAAKALIFADYRGLTVEQDTELRRALRKEGVNYRVVKNTLTSLAAKESNLEELEPYFKGPTAMASSDSDPVAPARILAEYAKKFPELELKVGVIEGRIVDIEEINKLAELPSKDVLIARVLGGFNTPLTSFVNVLNGNIRGLVIALNAIAQKNAGE
jgi:large subunit ribosomal protein L10